MDKIDFVLTWVDGSDPAWQQQYQEYIGEKQINFVQYRDYGALKYWFRSVEKFAPWVNTIHFVTCGQTPEWMNSNHPKLHLVSHKDYIPAEYLPTFSSHPIELNFHRIENLSERFVYFNDDTFLSAPVSQTDFFQKGLPRDSAAFSALIPSVKDEIITYVLFNDLLLLNANFRKKEALRGNIGKWLSLKYGKEMIKNLYYWPIGKFTGFVNPHLPNSFLKSTFNEVWEKEGEYLDRVCRNRFRTIEDVNQYLIRYWRLAEGKFIPRSPNIGACYTLGVDNAVIQRVLTGEQKKMVCINDNAALSDIEEQKEWLLALFEAWLPEKSEYEL